MEKYNQEDNDHLGRNLNENDNEKQIKMKKFYKWFDRL